jgi:O-acetyl-ADP-ribose deacetylase (regulator of RNase III)
MLTFAPALRMKADKKEEHVHRHIGLTAASTEMLEQQKESKKNRKI